MGKFKKTRILVALFIVTIIIVCIFYLYLPRVVPPLLKRALNNSQIELQSLRFSHPTHTAWRINHVELKQRSTSTPLQISARDVVIHYNLLDVIFGQVTGVTVGSCNVTIESSSVSALETEEASPALSIPFPALPIRYLDISLCQITTTQLSQPILLSGISSFSSDKLVTDILVNAPDRDQHQLKAAFNRDGAFHLSFARKRKKPDEFLSVSGVLPFEGMTQTIGEVRLAADIASTRSLLSDFDLKVIPESLTGDILLSASAPLAVETEATPLGTNVSGNLEAELSWGDTGEVVGELHFDYADTSVELTNSSPLQIEWKKNLYSSEAFKLMLHIESSTSAQASLTVDSLEIDSNGNRLAPTTSWLVNANITSDKEIVGNYSVSLASSPDKLLSGVFQQSTSEKSGSVSGTFAPTDVGQLLSVVSKLNSVTLPTELSVESGVMRGEFDASWGKDPTKIKGKLRINEVNGDYNELQFQKLSLVTQTENLFARPALTGTFSLSEFNAGLSMQDSSLRFTLHSLSKPRLLIQDFRTALLGGTVHAKKFNLSTTPPRASPTLQLTGIKLEEILKLYGDPNLEGIGTLDGEIPCKWSDGSISSKAATITARKPGGILRYKSNAGTAQMTESHPHLKLVYEALQNYHYNSLDVLGNYQPDGTLLISASLKGKNPDLNNGQPINVNLNIEEHIPSLLRSLRAVQAIGESVEKGLSKRH